MKLAKVERKATKEKQLCLPDANTADFERQLKKLATKGVVALFNAISKSKREVEEEGEEEVEGKEETKKKKKMNNGADASKKDIKEITKNNFLAMLQTASGSMDNKSKKSEAEATKSKWAALQEDPSTTSSSSVLHKRKTALTVSAIIHL